MKYAFLPFLVLLFFNFPTHFSSNKINKNGKILIDTIINKQPKSSSIKTDLFLENLLKKYPQYFNSIISQRDSFKVQIIYTQIDRDAKNTPYFKDYFFNVNPEKYFYPASTVKMPIALLALEKIKELTLPGLNKNSTLITESRYGRQTPVFNDPTSSDGRHSIAEYIKKIFLVSDNDAFNRLYEFLGQDYINERLHKMGYTDVEIRRRLAVWVNLDENRHTNPVSFYDPTDTKLLYQQPMQFATQQFPERNDLVGKGYYLNTGNTLVNQPLDFSTNNRISLEDQHQILRSIIFPEDVPKKQRFNINEEDYKFLYQYMSQFPPETKFPSYDSATTWDAYCKFLYWGSEKGALPKNIRIFNKVGDAYGFLTDIMYFTDQKTNVEFMLSATIYCNSDGILNDDKYDYETVGYPFMKNLGHIIYDYESKRKRAHIPDLSKFKMQYDK